MALPAKHRCPDCGRLCETASELTDHALYVHVDAPTPAAHIRPQRFGGLASAIAIGIAVLVGAGIYALAFFSEDLLLPDSAPSRQASVVHRMAVQLEGSGAVDEFRSVEPAGSWDVEYEVDDGDGYIRIDDEGTPAEALEYEAYDEDLREAMERVIRAQGFRIEE